MKSDNLFTGKDIPNYIWKGPYINMNLSELETILGQAVRTVATRMGIKNSEFYSVDELRDMIKEQDAKLSELLEAFIADYWQWFDFHRRIDATGKQGNLDRDEDEQLADLVGKRNATRSVLLKHLEC